MASPGVPHIVVPVSCSHCHQQQVVQVRASTTRTGRMNDDSVRCVKCGKDFDVIVPDEIVGGPFLSFLDFAVRTSN